MFIKTGGGILLRIIYSVLFAFTLGCVSQAARTNRVDIEPFSPKVIRANIDRFGAREVLVVMFSEEHRTKTIEAFSSANFEWQSLYPKLRPHSDGFWTEILDLGMSRFIDHMPSKAFPLLEEARAASNDAGLIESVCAMPPLIGDQASSLTRDELQKHFSARSKKIATLRFSSSSILVQKCAQATNAAMSGI